MQTHLRYLLLLLLFVCARASAQDVVADYYPYAEPEEPQPMLVSDTTLFYRAVQSGGDLFARIADFRLPQVALRRRGADFSEDRTLFAGLEIGWRYAPVLRLLGATENRTAGIAAPVAGAESVSGEIREFEFTAEEPFAPRYAAVQFSDRNYRVGAKLAADLQAGKGWRIRAALEARTGRDLYVDGVFTRALTAGVHVAKHFGRGRELSCLAVVPPSVRGTRLASTEEAFTLTGDRLYNPAWGFQHGRMRNSRVRREHVPLAVAVWHMPLTAVTSLAAAAGIETGIRRYSALGWYDARTPMPDNYRYLPSYTGDREAEEAWRNRDARYTQIRWDELIARNRMAGGAAAYALEDRVERLCRVQGDLFFTSRPDPRLTLGYGLFVRSHSARHYKELRDLLGAEYLPDLDHYLVDDDTYANLRQNDLRHPDRTVRRGDRFAYDYDLRVNETGLRLHASWRSDRLWADAGISLRHASVRRQGHYEKELFPGARSFGTSRRMRFNPYTLRAALGWSFSPRQALSLSLLAAAGLPDAADLFYQPRYNNRTVDNPVEERSVAAEVVYRLTGPVVTLQMAGFVRLTTDGIRTMRYYDDMAGLYCDLSAAGIGWRSYGAEAAADVRLAYRWRLSCSASAGNSSYVRDPRITVISDTDNTVVDMRAVSRMGGCRLGGAPQWTACAGVDYFGPKGWGVRLAAGYAGGRFVEPAFLRRTDRIAGQGGSVPELFAAFTRQERLDDALTVDATLSRNLRFGHTRLYLALLLRNLLGTDDTVYDGYESVRVRRMRVGDELRWQPHASNYTYARPRSFYLTVSCCF